MAESIVRQGVDTWVWGLAGKRAKNFHKGDWLRVQKDLRESLIRLKSPVKKNATVLEGQLVLKQVGTFAGTVTVTVQRAAEDWSAPRANWNNKPTGVPGATTSLTKTNPPAGTLWVFDIGSLQQAIANGAQDHGYIVESNSTTELKFLSMNASGNRPYLSVAWTTRPEKPTQLRPARGVVSTSHPVLSCDFTDKSGSRQMNAIQVQIDAAGDFTGPDWDSDLVPTDEPQLDLADTDYPGLPNGETTFWRVRVQDGAGLWSLWSDPGTFTRRTKGVLTLTNPAAAPNNKVFEFTPPIGWTFTGTQTHYRVMVAPAGRPKRILYDTEKVRSTENSHALPKGILRDDRSYIVTVQVWDNYVDREATSLDPVYVEQQRTFTVDFDATVAAPSALVAVRADPAPWVDVTWTRSTAPDSWTILRDAAAIETDLEPADVVDLDGLTYTWRDYTARPEVEHRYRVRSEVNGRLSLAGPIHDLVPACVGIWLADPSTGQEVVLGGKDFDATSTDQAETFTVIGSTDVIRSVMGLNGMTLTFSNLMLRSRDGFTWNELEETLYDFKSRATDTYRLAFGDLNIPVVLGDITIKPHQDTITGRVLKSVSFTAWQTGEHPFEVRV